MGAVPVSAAISEGVVPTIEGVGGVCVAEGKVIELVEVGEEEKAAALDLTFPAK